MDVCIGDACYSILDGQVDISVNWQWLVRLVQDVRKTYCLRYPQCQFSSSSYGITISSHPTTFQFVKENQIGWEGNFLCAHVVSTVNEILRSWLCYPSPDQCHIQAWLVHVLVKEFGQSVLYLNSVWKTYTGARRRSIDTQTWYISSFKDVKPLEQAAANHPLSNQSSSESCALQELAKLINGFLANDSNSLAQTEEDECMTNSVNNQMIYQLDSLTEKKVQIFCQFVTDCLSIFLKQNHVNAKLKNKIDKIPDKLIPF